MSLLLLVASIAVADVYSPELVDLPTVNRQFTATPFAQLLDAMLTLESANDAKCHSTACRFEDFLHGTPLSEEARQERFLRQKQLTRRLWETVARESDSSDGSNRLSPTNLSATIGQLVRVEPGSDPQQFALVFPQTGRELVIPATRRRQYGSISYSLRAVLGVQQDAIAGGNPLPPLDSDAIDAIKQAVDDASVCALLLSDESARTRNEASVSRESMTQAWRDLFGDALVAARSPREVDQQRADRAARQLLNGIVERKLAAYRGYNKLNADELLTLLLGNITRYYARYPPSQEPRLAMELLDAFNKAQVNFTVSLLTNAGRRAREEGHSVVRDADAMRAVAEILPQEIDDFEDVHLFTRLTGDRKITLESYDCDSFRDFGVHWVTLRSALKSLPPDERIPDPQAVEIIAEAVSQHGVLLLRLAGDHAVQELRRSYLAPEDVQHAVARIDELRREHHARPDGNVDVAEIVSSPASAAAPREGHETFFDDVTNHSGVRFEHRSSRWLGEYRRTTAASPPTFSGGGIAADDIDGDGHTDLLLVGGEGIALFAGDGAGRFRDVTVDAGLSARRDDGTQAEVRQPIVADFDNDGLPEILLTLANDQHRLFRNLGQGRFEDISDQAALGGRNRIGGPATVCDFDNDGLLDIYICYFGPYLSGVVPHYGHNSTNALPNALFRNEGNLRFRDITAGSGADNTGWAQAVSHVDFDRDGLQDIVIANDFGRNAMLRNLGRGRFQDMAVQFGMTATYHSMNVGITDINDDRFPDIYISNIGTMVKDNKYIMPNSDTPLIFNNEAMAAMLVKEANMLYLSHTDQNKFIGLHPSEHVERGVNSTAWAWDAEFFDFDNDQDEDLYVLNGNNDYNMFTEIHDGRFFRDAHTGETLSNRVLHVSYARTSNCFFENEGGKLRNRSTNSGAAFEGNSRSAVYLDFDEDGDLDIAVNNFHAPAVILRNNSESLDRHWLKVKLVGDPQQRTNRDAIGALIVATLPNGRRVMREVRCGSGYLSMEPKEQHFGLGKETKASVAVLWPNGELQDLGPLSADQRHVVHQSVLSAFIAPAEQDDGD